MKSITSLAAAITMATVVPALGQSLNIDFGDGLGVPEPAYPAAGPPGVWNVLDPQSPGPFSLVGLDGEPIGATASLSPPTMQLVVNDPLTTGNDELLLDDHLCGLGDIGIAFAFEGLENGRYKVTTYAWTPDVPNPQFNTTWVFINDDPKSVQIIGGVFPGQLQVGVTHAFHEEIQVVEGRLTIGMVGTYIGSNGALNGVQLVRTPGVFGDINGDGVVDVQDLLLLLAAWGPCPGCSADLDGDGLVNVADLLLLLANWT